MTRLFNKGGDGAGEIVRVLGLIDNDLDFTKWEPILPLGIRDLQAIIGKEPIDALDKYYREDHADVSETDSMAETLRLMQQAVAMFTWLKVIPTLDAQHGTAGRGKHLGENETGMTALQEFKDEENIRNLAYEAVDALVELLDREKFDFWINGITFRFRHFTVFHQYPAMTEDLLRKWQVKSHQHNWPVNSVETNNFFTY